MKQARVRSFVTADARQMRGATKRAAELIVASIGQSNGGTQFVSVRFGNVLGSNGSVVPIFQSQIASGGTSHGYPS